MTAPRLHDVIARVVAWHNRHPLARRIQPSQVHSIGEVLLPFVSKQPLAGATASVARTPPADADNATATPTSTRTSTLAQALAARHQAAQAPAEATDGREGQAPRPEGAASPAAPNTPATPAEPQAEDVRPGTVAPEEDPDQDGEAALVIPLLDGDVASNSADTAVDLAEPATPADPPDIGVLAELAAAEAEAQTPPQAPSAPAQPPADSTRPLADTLQHNAAAHATAADTGVPVSALAQAMQRRAATRTDVSNAVAIGPAAVPPRRLQRLLDRLRTACTGRQPGMPPLRAAFSREFIWPLRPGNVARWVQRHGQTQPLAPADWPQRRIDADPARLSRLRQNGQSHDVPLHVLTAAIGVGDRRIRVLLSVDGSVLGPHRAYNPALVGSLGALLAVGLLGAGWTLRPHLASPLAPPLLPHAEAPVFAVAAVAPASAASASNLPASAAAPMAETASGSDDAASASALAAADAPANADSQPQASIRPTLSDDARLAAKREGAKLRGEPPPPEPVAGPVYAVVSKPSPQREAAASSLALMQAAAAKLDGDAPGHGELLSSGGTWRAAWWPFTTLVDAERARVLLAGRGVQAEVVEF